MDNDIRKAVAQACRNLMIPIARFLLRNGFGYREFAEIAKWAFVQVASDDYGIRGRRTNVSRVAVMTGLGRKEIRRLRESMASRERAGLEQVSKAGALLSSWHQDMEFLDDTGLPKALPIDGVGATFSRLVSKVAGDIPVGAILHELQRTGTIRETAEGSLIPRRRHFVPLQDDAEMVLRFGLRIGELASTIDYNASAKDDPLKRFEATAYSTRLDRESLPLFRRLAADQGLKFLEQMDSWLTAHELPRETGSLGASEESRTPARAGVGVYVFEEESGPLDLPP